MQTTEIYKDPGTLTDGSTQQEVIVPERPEEIVIDMLEIDPNITGGSTMDEEEADVFDMLSPDPDLTDGSTSLEEEAPPMFSEEPNLTGGSAMDESVNEEDDDGAEPDLDEGSYMEEE